MPIDNTDGYTNVEQATERWGRNRNWWYTQVREGHLTGYKVPGERGTYLRDEEVEQYLRPQPISREDQNQQTGS